MSEHRNGSASKLAEAFLVLYVQTRRNREGRKAAQILEKLQSEYPDLGKLKVIEVKSNSIGEDLPFLATKLGVVRGLDQIEYFANSERRLRTAESAA